MENDACNMEIDAQTSFYQDVTKNLYIQYMWWRGRDSSESGPSGRGVTVLFGSPNVIGPGYSITACLALTQKKKKKKMYKCCCPDPKLHTSRSEQIFFTRAAKSLPKHFDWTLIYSLRKLSFNAPAEK